MAAYDSTNAILGIKAAEQNKKNSRWQKLMDIASLGTNIWETLSGRKYQTGEREASEEFAGEQAGIGMEHDVAMAEEGQVHAKEQFDWRATFDADQAAQDRASRETQNALDRDLEKQLSAARIAAQMRDRSQERMSFLATWTQRAYELAVSNPAFLDANGVFDPAKREGLRKFLYSQVDGLPALNEEEVAFAKKSFDGFVDGLGSAPTADITKDPAAVTPAPAPKTIVDDALATVQKLRSMYLPPEIKQEVDALEAQIPTGPPSSGSGPQSRNVRAILTQLTTIYNTLSGNRSQNRTGQAEGDIRLIK